MKKCSWWRLHHYHEIPGTRKKIKPNKPNHKCEENSYISDHYVGDCVEFTVEWRCCNCDKRKKVKLLDFDILRAMSYPDNE